MCCYWAGIASCTSCQLIPYHALPRPPAVFISCFQASRDPTTVESNIILKVWPNRKTSPFLVPKDELTHRLTHRLLVDPMPAQRNARQAESISFSHGFSAPILPGRMGLRVCSRETNVVCSDLYLSIYVPSKLLLPQHVGRFLC